MTIKSGLALAILFFGTSPSWAATDLKDFLAHYYQDEVFDDEGTVCGGNIVKYETLERKQNTLLVKAWVTRTDDYCKTESLDLDTLEIEIAPVSATVYTRAKIKSSYRLIKEFRVPMLN